jgi:hypothetical protein
MIPTKSIMVPAIDTEIGLIGDLPAEISVLCATCARLRDGLSCEAFPEGISDSILSGRVDHRLPWPGDHGLRYILASKVIPPKGLPAIE